MIREGREVRSRTDYILGMDHRLFGNVSVQDPRHNSDHYMVLGCLRSTSLKEHAQYLGGNKETPPPPTDRTNEGGYNPRGHTKGCYETAGSGGPEKRMDIGGNVETR